MDGGGGEAEKLTDAPEGVGASTGSRTRPASVYLAREPRPKPLQAAHEDKQDRKDDAVVERAGKVPQQIWRIGRDDKKAKLVHPGDYGIGEIAVVAGRANRSPSRPTTPAKSTTTTKPTSGSWTSRPAQTRQLTDGPGGKYPPGLVAGRQRVLFIALPGPGLVVLPGELVRRALPTAARLSI